MNHNNTLFLRFIAILLVINSHMDEIYPIPLFATGGAIGNALFFMLSAYGLLLSQRANPQTLATYMTKRILRIYPVVWSSILFLVLPLTLYYYHFIPSYYPVMAQLFGLKDPLSAIGNLFYPPEDYWFLRALMLYYLVGFFFLRNYHPRKIFNALGILTLVYFLSYLQFSDFSTLVIEQTIAFKLIFYAMVFLIGIYFASIHEKIRYRGKRDFFLFFGFIVLIYGEKYLMLKGIAPQLQFFQQLLLFPTLYYALKISQSPFVLTTLMGRAFLARPITLIGVMTLELYLVHGLIRPLLVYYFPHFPENLILFLLLTLILSYGLYRINTYLIHRIQGKIA